MLIKTDLINLSHLRLNHTIVTSGQITIRVRTGFHAGAGTDFLIDVFEMVPRTTSEWPNIFQRLPSLLIERFRSNLSATASTRLTTGQLIYAFWRESPQKLALDRAVQFDFGNKSCCAECDFRSTGKKAKPKCLASNKESFLSGRLNMIFASSENHSSLSPTCINRSRKSADRHGS